uniref:Uncharacterized protein n=1 Tax=Solibacter usitatus (strain Ellin6076) TaxID=234267 RepID=Q01S88_SOLUE
MKRELVEKIADAVLYEGYMLYPYTASSLKNQKRWNFGVLAPAESGTGEMRTECLMTAGEACELEVRVRFLWYCGGDEPDTREIDLRGMHSAKSVPLPNGGRAVVETASERVQGRLFRVSVVVRNETAFEGNGDATASSMLSTHTILSVRGGEFWSLIDPPEAYREAAAGCHNLGTWPVLVGTEGERDMMLSSPIILYDYPQVAPESPGDLFDGAEIDEILTLRILTLSEEEKAEIRGGGARAREVLERSETLPPQQIMKLHGALRGLRHAAAKLRQGDRVRLRPRHGADIFDIALTGKLATVEAVEHDFEGKVHVAVVLEDDPGRELGWLRQPGHRFFFSAEEVELAP